MPQPAWKFAFVSALMTMTADVATAARPAPVKEVSRQIEVIVGGRLRETTTGQGELSISLWNKTDSAIAGPIFLVVDETGLQNVQVGSHSTETKDGKPIFELVPVDKELLPGGMTKSFPLAFSIPAGLSREEADKLHLETRVFGRQGSPDASKLSRDQAAREDAEFATKGKNYTQAELNAAIATQQQVTRQLADKPDVFGTAIAEDDKGNLTLRVYTDTRAAAKALPGSYGDLPVDVKPLPGGFKGGASLTSVAVGDGKATSQATRDRQASPARKNSPKGATSPTAARNPARPRVVVDVDQMGRFDRPVPIGVSSFNSDVICASGTLGARVKDPSGKLYALSNTHVWGEFGFAVVGQNIVQPATGDNNCAIVPEDVIGTVAGFTEYRNMIVQSPFFRPGLALNFIDAAIMEVGTGLDPMGNEVVAVGFATPSDGYGAPSKRILRQNRIGLRVQKYGRTTGYTQGRTTAINLAPIVAADPVDRDLDTPFFRIDEYVGEIPDDPFSAGGDSGSLIVTLEDRRPVSLLFAGRQTLTLDVTLGNRIGPVLDWFNVQIDDGTDPNVHVDGTGNIGMLGRGGLAMGNIVPRDLTDFMITDNAGNLINDLLPAELWGRVKKNRRPLIPVNNGFGPPPGVLP